MENRLYEYGEIADILIKFKTDKIIDGISYKAGMVYTVLKDIQLQLDYEQTNSNTNGVKPVISTRSGRPYRIIITSIPLTKKICNLMLSPTEKEYTYTKREIITCWKNGELNLTNNPINDEIFAYEDETCKNIDVSLSDKPDIIYGDFIQDKSYLVFYKQLKNGDSYNFETPHFGYFELEVFIKGNTNKITNNVFMHFDAASLVGVPNFNILNGGLLNTPLVFDIIYANQKEPLIVFD